MRAARAIALAAAFTSSAASAGDHNCEREMARAADRHGVPLGMLYAVGLTETGRGDSLRPYALNIEGRAVYDIDKGEALRRVEAARMAGIKLIDIGCMQVNHHFHARNFASVADMLDPARNVDYAARFLNELKAREGSWTKAVARYHAGPNNDPAQKKYVCRVIANMVATGFGRVDAGGDPFCTRGRGLDLSVVSGLTLRSRQHDQDRIARALPPLLRRHRRSGEAEIGRRLRAGPRGCAGRFCINHVGRSDGDIRGRLLDFIGSSTLFKYGYSASVTDGLREGVPALSRYQPAGQPGAPGPPQGHYLGCPRCRMFDPAGASSSITSASAAW